jgi:ABC-type dipeptide/oligopeptide/nickel transport system permease component
MAVAAGSAVNRPSRFSVAVTLVARVLFATLLFTAAGMAVGLLIGILGTIVWGMIRGGNIDMRNAYLHVAMPSAVLLGTIAFFGSIYLELRARRTSQER